MNKILFLEDEHDLGHVVMQYLKVMDFDVEWFKAAENAFQAFKKNPQIYDIAIIDVQLPGQNGFDFAKDILKMEPNISFIFLTARNEKKDRIFGLKLGADDYVNKPFDIDELVLRIRNILKRKQPAKDKIYDKNGVADLQLHKESLRMSVGVDKKNIALTVREFDLLEYLVEQKNKVVKKEDILIKLWGGNDYFAGRSLDVFISRLRKQLANSKFISIENVYGVGYILNVKN